MTLRGALSWPPVAGSQIKNLLLTPEVSAQLAGDVSGCARRKQELELFDLETRHRQALLCVSAPARLIFQTYFCLFQRYLHIASGGRALD